MISMEEGWDLKDVFDSGNVILTSIFLDFLTFEEETDSTMSKFKEPEESLYFKLSVLKSISWFEEKISLVKVGRDVNFFDFFLIFDLDVSENEGRSNSFTGGEIKGVEL